MFLVNDTTKFIVQQMSEGIMVGLLALSGWHLSASVQVKAFEQRLRK